MKLEEQVASFKRDVQNDAIRKSVGTSPATPARRNTLPVGPMKSTPKYDKHDKALNTSLKFPSPDTTDNWTETSFSSIAEKLEDVKNSGNVWPGQRDVDSQVGAKGFGKTVNEVISEVEEENWDEDKQEYETDQKNGILDDNKHDSWDEKENASQEYDQDDWDDHGDQNKACVKKGFKSSNGISMALTNNDASVYVSATQTPSSSSGSNRSTTIVMKTKCFVHNDTESEEPSFDKESIGCETEGTVANRECQTEPADVSSIGCETSLYYPAEENVNKDEKWVITQCIVLILVSYMKSFSSLGINLYSVPSGKITFRLKI